MHLNEGETNDTVPEIAAGEANGTAPGTEEEQRSENGEEEEIINCNACTCEGFTPSQDDPNVCGRVTRFREVFRTRNKVGLFPLIKDNLKSRFKNVKKHNDLTSRELRRLRKRDNLAPYRMDACEIEDYIDHPENGLTVLRDDENKPYISSEEHEKHDHDVIHRYIDRNLLPGTYERYLQTGKHYLNAMEEQSIVQEPDTWCGHDISEHGNQEAS